MTDEKLIELLKTGKAERAFVKLYNSYPKILSLIKSKGGTKLDAEDIFQEALIVLYNKVQDGNFKLSSSISTYLFSVCRFIWKNKSKKKGIDTTILDEDFQENEISSINIEEKYSVAEMALSQLGKKCLEILKAYYYQSLSMKSIANKFDFKSEKIAKNQKYKCLEKAKQNYIGIIQNGGQL